MQFLKGVVFLRSIKSKLKYKQPNNQDNVFKNRLLSGGVFLCPDLSVGPALMSPNLEPKEEVGKTGRNQGVL